MKSFGKVNCDLTVQLGGGGIQPVDRAELAVWLRRIGQPGAGRSRAGAATTIAGIADEVEAATGDEVTVEITMSAEAADSIRLALIGLTDKAVNPPRGLPRDELKSHRAAAYGLSMFYRAWVNSTGWQGIKQISDGQGNAAPGSGYSR